MLQENNSRVSPVTATALLFRHSDGVVPNTLAIGYTFFGYGFSLYLLGQNGWLFLTGILLLAHSLIIAAYLLHECIHGTLFHQSTTNTTDGHRLLAEMLSWITGACYADFTKIKDKHLRHHFERADIVALDYRRLLARHAVLRKALLLGQNCCLPAVDLLMHTLVILRPFGPEGAPKQRQRVVIVTLLRVMFLSLLVALADWQLLFGYVLAYLLFLGVLNFMDAFQHQYLMLEGLELERGASPTRDTDRFQQGYFNREYENSHTFSNLISERWPWLNVLVLNFAYHNVHHQQPLQPWYRLSKLHQQACLQDENSIQMVPLKSQLQAYFRYRGDRVMSPASDDREQTNLGAVGVSFLTPL